MANTIEVRRLGHLRELVDVVARHSESYQQDGHPFAGVRGWRDGLCIGMVLARRFPDLASRLLSDVVDMARLWGAVRDATEQRAVRISDQLEATVVDTLRLESGERLDSAALLQLGGRVCLLYDHSFPQAPGPAAWIDALAVGLVYECRFPKSSRVLFHHMCAMATLLTEEPAERFEELMIGGAAAFEEDVRPLIESPTHQDMKGTPGGHISS